MRKITKKELLNKAIKLNYDSEIPLLKGIFIIQERTLHDSGYRLMNIIGHSEYKEELKDFKYYLISSCSDVVDFNPLFKNLIQGDFSMGDIHLDINKYGIIHIWTNSNKWLKCWGTNLSNCSFEFINKGEEDKKIEKLKNLNLTDIDINKEIELYSVSTKQIVLDIQTMQKWINKIIDHIEKNKE